MRTTDPLVTWRCACGHRVVLPVDTHPDRAHYIEHASAIDAPYHSGPWGSETGQQELPMEVGR